MTTPPSLPPPPRREPEGAQASAQPPEPPEPPGELWGYHHGPGSEWETSYTDGFFTYAHPVYTTKEEAELWREEDCGETAIVALIGISPAVREQRDRALAAINLALECAEKRLADVPQYPCRVDEMTEREQGIENVASHVCGALMFIRDVLTEARPALTEIEGGGRVGTDKGEQGDG